jgi:hypothetical protein
MSSNQEADMRRRAKEGVAQADANPSATDTEGKELAKSYDLEHLVTDD